MTSDVQVMREMGFEYDPSTAGSSVRFDPPDPRDPVSHYASISGSYRHSNLSGFAAHHLPQAFVYFIKL